MVDPATRALRTERFDIKALYETSQLLSASLDLEFVLNNLLLTAMSKLLVTRGTVLLHDPLEGAYRVAATKGLTDVRTGDWIRMEPVPSTHLLHDGEVPPELAGHRLVLVAPVAFGHRDIGLVGLGPKATGVPYDERELEFIRLLVNMSSTAVHNSIMVEELKQANRDLDSKIQELNTLFDLSQEFNATIERDRLVKILSFALMGQMTINRHLFLLKRSEGGAPEDGGFRVITARGIKNTKLDPALVGALRDRKELLLLQDDEPDGPWVRLKERGLVLVLPLRQHGETCGVLCLGPKMTGQAYQPGDVEFLSSLGNLALVSIQNSYLVEEQIEKERLEKEMRLARQIQERLLPQVIPTLPGIAVASLAIPSRFVGGDYYGVYRVHGERLLLAIADVTGKGVPASLLMANLQACLQVLLPMDVTIEEGAAHINRVICENTDYDKFITFFYGIYHGADGAFTYVNAGHNPPMLVRADGTIEELDRGGLLLGVMKSAPYERGSVALGPGDVLALFTDGVTEAMSPDDEEFTEARLEACLRAHRHQPAQAILNAVHDEIRAFTHDPATLSDDLTMVVLKVEEAVNER